MIGAAARRPIPAFFLGVASHFVLDATPHWGRFGVGRRIFLVAVPDGLVGLAAMWIMTAIAPPDRRAAMSQAWPGPR